MAVGDVVSGVSTTDITYQPAAGVEVLITSFGGAADSAHYCNLYNGTTAARQDKYVTATNRGGAVKVFLNNTNYLQIVGTADNRGYTGIQTK